MAVQEATKLNGESPAQLEPVGKPQEEYAGHPSWRLGYGPLQSRGQEQYEGGLCFHGRHGVGTPTGTQAGVGLLSEFRRKACCLLQQPCRLAKPPDCPLYSS